MLNLKNNSTNNFALRLPCVSAETSYFLFKLNSLTTNEDFNFILKDESPARSRFSEFNLTLTGITDVIMSAQTYYLSPLGNFDFKIFSISEEEAAEAMSVEPLKEIFQAENKICLKRDTIVLTDEKGTNESLIYATHTYSGASDMKNFIYETPF